MVLDPKTMLMLTFLTAVPTTTSPMTTSKEAIMPGDATDSNNTYDVFYAHPMTVEQPPAYLTSSAVYPLERIPSNSIEFQS
ncbi:hypothetical protein DEU56DRAFT_985356 [Suillus clintonianus]|uniref:uncharacterized protein n=1 Tax=Suillus clintonianus TaxID=1904413 RepID=UPI001B8716C7|nr:uncharacterized protein DEU56DRAFT_985356 [Suillus clintonianus]KAG2111351.1 hypothetical protein DEU56DRAFT_985356 [Suillus clintonianus]